MKSVLDEECQARSWLSQRRTRALAHHRQPLEILTVPAPKLPAHRERVKDFARRLHEEHERALTAFFPAPAPARDQRRKTIRRPASIALSNAAADGLT
jgi:hypothetical protein